jgi:ABC-type spermidine/putrescine transport system permease subunit I
MPLIAVASALLVVPLAIVVWVSFTQDDSFFFTTEYTLDNYLSFGGRFSRLVPNSLLLAASVTLLSVLVGVPFAYLLDRRLRYRNWIRPLLILPLFGGLYLAYGMRTLLLPGGLLHPAFDLLGLDATSFLYSRSSVIFTLTVYTLPFMVLNVGASLQRLDPSFEEAATSLGASTITRWRRIVLPLLRPGILAGGLIVFVLSLGEFAIPSLVGGPEEQGLLSIVVAERALRTQDFGTAAALGMVMVLFAFCATYFSYRASAERFRD